jgi:hypothetical protein
VPHLKVDAVAGSRDPFACVLLASCSHGTLGMPTSWPAAERVAERRRVAEGARVSAGGGAHSCTRLAGCDPPRSPVLSRGLIEFEAARTFTRSNAQHSAPHPALPPHDRERWRTGAAPVECAAVCERAARDVPVEVLELLEHGHGGVDVRPVSERLPDRNSALPRAPSPSPASPGAPSAENPRRRVLAGCAPRRRPPAAGRGWPGQPR